VYLRTVGAVTVDNIDDAFKCMEYIFTTIALGNRAVSSSYINNILDLVNSTSTNFFGSHSLGFWKAFVDTPYNEAVHFLPMDPASLPWRSKPNCLLNYFL
jgi:hypothetical protein